MHCLSSTSARIANCHSVPYRSTISPEYGLALALTHSEALIWSYNSSSNSPSTKGTFSFKLPFPPPAPTDPLPLGAFTARSVGSEPGLVVVTSARGRIAYWETITNASSFLPGQTSSGIQGSVPGMFSGETIKEIINAEPAGFILTFSHGRVAHLTVKDQLGRPAIGVQFLRKSGGTTTGGFFGSIRNIIGGERRKTVATARAGRSTKGQRDVMIATEDGEFEVWSTHLNVGDSLIFELDLKEDLLESLKHNLPDHSQNEFSFKLVDFVISASSTTGNELIKNNGLPSYSVLLLASLTQRSVSTYYILEAGISNQGSSIDVVHPTSCYKPTPSETTRWKPRLSVPKPGQVAFVVFETAIVMFSLARVEESPSSQLLMEGQKLPEPFQDCIKFQNETIYRVLGLASEDRGSQEKSSSCAITVQGFGIIRITSTAPLNVDEEVEEVRVTLKSRIEQAVFFGTIRQNPLDFTNTGQQTHSSEEIEEAALSISHEILSSTSKYIPKSSPSIEQHLKLRAKALEDLALHVQKHYSPISRILKWRLLWGAEKLTAAQAMWKVQEDIVKRKPKDREETYWAQVLFFMDSRYRAKADKAKGETDSVRLFLTKDVHRIENVLNWLPEAHGDVKEDGFLKEKDVVENVRESSDLWIAAFEAAYRFREDSASLYGLGDEIFDPAHGILKSGYEDLPEAWTFEQKACHNAERLLDLAYNTTLEWWEPSKTNDAAKPSRKTVIHMAHALPRQVDLYQRMFAERYAWLMEQNHEEHPNYPEQARKMMKWGIHNRREYFHRIARLGLMQEAIDLAEHWLDMKALVDLNIEAEKQVIQRAKHSTHASASEVRRIEVELEIIHVRTESYFDKYGSKWANAHFSSMVSHGELGSLLSESQDDEKKQPYLTNYLRKNKGFQKINWINDAIGERDIGHAGKTLESLAKNREGDLWTKKIELCLAKLANLAASETDSKSTTVNSDISIKQFDNRLALLEIQDRLLAHILPSIGPVIDAAGAQQVALETFGKRVVGDKKYPALKALLNDGLGILLRRKPVPPERLIDILTLMDPVEYDGHETENPHILGHEFWLALEVLRLSELDATAVEGLIHLIWRRAMIRDDWVLLNDTADKVDEEVTSDMTQTTLFRTLFQYFEHVQQGPQISGKTKLLNPSQIATSHIFPQSLQKRFRENEIELVERDLEAEDEVLKIYIEKARLELHYGGLLKMAQATVRAEADQEGDRIAGEVEKA
jgi:nuclear pore complex protein Nup133